MRQDCAAGDGGLSDCDGEDGGKGEGSNLETQLLSDVIGEGHITFGGKLPEVKFFRYRQANLQPRFTNLLTHGSELSQ
jgi:hypothetical protein